MITALMYRAFAEPEAARSARNLSGTAGTGDAFPDSSQGFTLRRVFFIFRKKEQ